MTTPPRQIHLGLFMHSAGHHVAGWRYPGAEFGSENLPHMQRIVASAERAKFDMIFLADGLTSAADAHPSMVARFEPLTALAALLVVTAWSMSEPHRWRQHLRARPADRFLLLLTMTLTVVSDLTVAIAVGTAIGLAQRLIRRNVEPAVWTPPDR